MIHKMLLGGPKLRKITINGTIKIISLKKHYCGEYYNRVYARKNKPAYRLEIKREVPSVNNEGIINL